MARVYTPEEQARYAQQFPNVEWINGTPYTPDTAAPQASSYAPDGTPLDYMGQPLTSPTNPSLVEANFKERIPWEFLVAQVAAPALVAGGQAGLSALSSGGAGGGAAAGTTAAGAGGGGAAAAAPALTTPVWSAAPGVGAAAGGGGLFGGMSASTLIPAAGSFVSGLSQGMTNARTEADNRAATQDVLRTSQAGQEAATEGQRVQLQIQQQEAAQREQADAYRKALLGALGSNIQDVSLDRSGFHSDIPTISFQGGLRPSALGQTGRDAASVLERQAMTRLMTPTTPEALPTYEAPTLSEPTQAGFWEKLLSPVGAGLSVAGNMNRVAPTTQAPGARRVG
jgi:hypothetical protein